MANIWSKYESDRIIGRVEGHVCWLTIWIGQAIYNIRVHVHDKANDNDWTEYEFVTFRGAATMLTT